MTDRLFSYGAPLGGYIDPVTGKLTLDIGRRPQPAPQAPPTPVDANLITAPGMGGGTYPERLAKLRQWFDPETYGPTGGATWEQPSALLPMAMHPGPGGVPEEKLAIPRAIKEAAQYGIDLLASPWTGGVPESFVAGTAMNALTGGHDPSQLGMFLGKTAKNFPTEAAATAKQMLKEGMDRSHVYQATGVGKMKSTANNPFFEISDAESAGVEYRPGQALNEATRRSGAMPGTETFRRRRDELENAGWQTTLGEVLDHPELYANHPELASMPVKIEPRGNVSGNLGAYNPATKSIDITPSQFYNLQRGKSTLLHEIQHAIQGIENWPKGANPDWMANLHGMGGTAEKALAARAVLKRSVPAGMDPAEYVKQAAGPEAVDHPVMNAALNPKLSDAYLRRLAKVHKAGAKSKPEDVGMDLYRRVAGEWQARMTQRRADLGMEERQAYAPWDQSQLIGETPEQAQIVLDQASGNPVMAGQRDSDYVKLYHGTNDEGHTAITSSGEIRGSPTSPAAFTPRKDMAQNYGPHVIEANVPKSKLKIDLDLPGGKLLSVEDANGYGEAAGLNSADWTIDDWINNGYSVGTEEPIATGRRPAAVNPFFDLSKL